jgi:hypothetical protein
MNQGSDGEIKQMVRRKWTGPPYEIGIPARSFVTFS